MSTFKNLSSISFGLFAMIGLAYFLTVLFVQNQMFLPTTFTIQRILQIPFIISTLAYFTAVILEPLAMEEKKPTILMGIFISISILLLFGVLFLHFTQTT